MKRLIASGTSAIMLLSLAAMQAHAASLCPPAESKFNPLCGLGTGSEGPGVIVGRALAVAFLISVILALFYLVWGGLKWIYSGGDKTGVEAARNHIIAAIIGLVIIFLSYFIINFIIGLFLPGFNITTFQIPSITTGTP